jgi:endoglucanase
LPIIAAIRRDLVVMRPVPTGGPGASSARQDQLPILLPGKTGFITQKGTTPDTVTLNLSYWIYPAFAAFALADESSDGAAFWRQLAVSGRRLTDLAAAGNAAGLPPDWLDLTSLQPDVGHDPRASYDALRIPLWQIWAGEAPSAGAAWRYLWRDRNKAWIDVTTQVTAAYAPGPEQRAVLRLIDLSSGADWRGQPPPDMPATMPARSYFSSAIALLSLTAEAERSVDATP